DCRDPWPMIDAVAHSAESHLLLLFACRCCRRIAHLIPTAAGRAALEASERFCTRRGATVLAMERAARQAKTDEENMRARMTRAPVPSQKLDATCASFYATVAVRMTAMYCADPALDTANDVSDNVALAQAFNIAAHRAPGDSSSLEEMQKRFAHD